MTNTEGEKCKILLRGLRINTQGIILNVINIKILIKGVNNKYFATSISFSVSRIASITTLSK